MASQGGYAFVDADEDDAGLEFKTFLPSEGASGGGSGGSGGGGGGGGGGGSSIGARGYGEVRDASVPYSVFNLAYYQVYFDVETLTVLKRVALSMIPRGGFIQDVCEGHVDLYGPFWSLTTLILVLYTTSTLTSSLAQYMAGEPVVTNIPLLSTATSLIYVYGLGIPALLWGATRWLGVGEWGPAEALCIYGYAMAVFIPVSLLCLIPIGIARWVFVGAGALSSGFFLVTNIYPVLAAGENKFLRVLIIAVGALHAGLALAMKILFYSYAVGGKNIGPDPGAPAGGIAQPVEEAAKRALAYLAGR